MSKTIYDLDDGITEAKIAQFFGVVGRVERVRLAIDRETSKFRGFAFVDFSDPQMAHSAVRNLNNTKIVENGNDISIEIASEPASAAPSGPVSAPSAPKSTSIVPPLGRGQNVDQITRVVSQLSQQEKIEILTQMKTLVMQNPETTENLLIENPQLAQALLAIQISFGLVTPVDIEQIRSAMAPPPIMGGVVPPAGPLPTAPTPGATPMMAAGMATPQHMMTPQYGHPAPAAGMPHPPPGSQTPLGPGAPSAPAASTQDELAKLDEKQRSMLDRVMHLTEEQISQLQPHLRNQVLQVRHAMASGQGAALTQMLGGGGGAPAGTPAAPGGPPRPPPAPGPPHPAAPQGAMPPPSGAFPPGHPSYRPS